VQTSLHLPCSATNKKFKTKNDKTQAANKKTQTETKPKHDAVFLKCKRIQQHLNNEQYVHLRNQELRNDRRPKQTNQHKLRPTIKTRTVFLCVVS
jgi:hypothetical protein